MNTSNNNLKEYLLDKLEELKDYILRNIKILLPIVVGVIAIVISSIALVAHNKKVKQQQEEEAAALAQQQQSQLDTSEISIAIPEVPLELNQYPAVNDLINKYYIAMADGDIDTVKSINSFIDDTETIRIEETAKYIDEYTKIDAYTKIGPSDGTYLVYVSSCVVFSDYEGEVPGLEAYYLCTDENGNLYINEGEEDESVTNYIREVSLQDDVVDLNNEIAVAYNDMLAADENLAVFLVDLTETIDTSVGEALAQAEAPIEETTEEEAEVTEEETGVVTEVVTTVKATTTVNVRSSDSETADKVGKVSEGTELKLVEKKGNGWSEVIYEGKNAFIKSEFLEASGTETVVNVPEKTISEAPETTETTETSTTTTNTGSTKVSGTVTVKENVRIRAGASETADKIATAYVGQKLDLIMKQSDGWTKIKYNGQIAYVKSEFVE